MVPLAPALVVLSAVATLYLSAVGGYFAKDACSRLEVALERSVVGQPLATEQLLSAICEHIKTGKDTNKPLVISLHGPPGVGKSFSHTIIARALYGLAGGPETLHQSMRSTIIESSDFLGNSLQGLKAPAELMKNLASLDCPGNGCPGYKVLYGLDFLSAEKTSHFHYFRQALIKHARSYREAVVVVEEYDKLACDARVVLRQLLEHPESANTTMRHSIVLLESNLGTFELQNLLHKHNFQQEKITPEEAHQSLKSLIHDHWASSCEPRIDTIKALNLIDFFIPFFPLGREEIGKLIKMRLQAWEKDHNLSKMSWDNRVTKFLLSKIHFQGDYPLDGARDVDSVLTRHVARAIRNLMGAKTFKQQHSKVDVRPGIHLSLDRLGNKIVASYL